MAQGSQQLYYCLFHYPHLHQPYSSCPPLSLCSGLSPLPSQQVHISVYNGQEKQGWLERHKTSHRFEHCPERSINLLSTACSTESRYSYLNLLNSPFLPPYSFKVLHKSAYNTISFSDLSLMPLHSTQLAAPQIPV